MNFSGKIQFKKKKNKEKDTYRGMNISKAKKLGWNVKNKITNLDLALKITVKGVQYKVTEFFYLRITSSLKVSDS